MGFFLKFCCPSQVISQNKIFLNFYFIYLSLGYKKNEKKYLYGREQHKIIVKDKKAEVSSVYKKLV